MKKLIKNKYFLTTIFGIIIYLLYLCMMKIVPFGENSILKCDLYQQYVNFFCYLKDVLLNGKSIMMSWNLGLGNNFFTTFAYYLASPLNIIVIFFNSENMDIGVEILTLIKILLIANSAVFYLKHTYKYEKNDIIIFGLIYAYCSYVICYSFHIMWLDCLYVLPIALYFVDKFIDGGKIYPVILALTYGLWTNYYLGFINAFVAGIYFIAKYIIKNKITEKGQIKKFVKKLIIFIFSIAISFGIIMVLFIPSIRQLSGNMSTQNTKIINIENEKIAALSNVFFNNYVYDYSEQAGLMFASTIISALIPLYYLNKKVDIKEKIVFSSILIFLMLPIISPILNKIWHGFTTPNCFYYRYSYAFIFITIIMAFREYQNLKETKKTHYLVSILIFGLITVAEIICNKKYYFPETNFKITNVDIVISVLIYLGMIITLYIKENVKKLNVEKGITTVLLLLIIVDLMIGAKNGQENNDKYFKREYFTQYNTIMQEIQTKLENPETERIIFMPDVYGNNMSMRFGYSNIGYFTSARNKDTIKNMYKLGYNIQRADGLWLTSFSGTNINYSLVGVKYYISKEKLEDNQIYGFEYIETCDGYYIYKNKNAFDIGFYLKDNVSTENKNPFEIQNEYLCNMNEEEQERYFEDIDKTDIVTCKKEVNYDETTKTYNVKYTVKAKKDTNLYIFSDNNLQLYINQEVKFKKYADLWSTEAGIKGIKHLNKGEEFKFEISTMSDLEKIYIYASDNDKIQNLLDHKNDKNKFDEKEILSNGLDGTANFENDGYLVLGISYDSGWKAYVDGKEADIGPISDVFTGIKLEKGTHKIHIYYEVPGYKLGLKITILSLAITIIIIAIEIESNKKKLLLTRKNER